MVQDINQLLDLRSGFHSIFIQGCPLHKQNKVCSAKLREISRCLRSFTGRGACIEHNLAHRFSSRRCHLLGHICSHSLATENTVIRKAVSVWFCPPDLRLGPCGENQVSRRRDQVKLERPAPGIILADMNHRSDAARRNIQFYHLCCDHELSPSSPPGVSGSGSGSGSAVTAVMIPS